MGVHKVIHFWICFSILAYVLFLNDQLFQIWSYIVTVIALMPLSSWVMYFTRKFVFNPHLRSKGKAVLITGCDSGIGFLLAKRLDELGYCVFAACLDPPGEGAKELKQSCSSKLTIIPLDVRKQKSVDSALHVVKKNLKDNVFWALVNNAGVTQAGEIEWTPMEEFEKVQEVNSFGMVRVTKAFLPLLRQHKGRIVNNTSFCAHLSFPGYVGYCMSKWSAGSFTNGLRVEMMKWGVKVISVEAFFYKTPSTTYESTSKLLEATYKRSPPDVQEAYGDEYISSFKTSCKRLVNKSSVHVMEVVDCLEDAIASRDPLRSYFPCYFPYKVGLSFFLILPRCIVETYQRLNMPWTKPKALKMNSEMNGSNLSMQNGHDESLTNDVGMKTTRSTFKQE